MSTGIKKTGVTLRLVTKISDKEEAMKVAKELGILDQFGYDPEKSQHIMDKAMF